MEICLSCVRDLCDECGVCDCCTIDATSVNGGRISNPTSVGGRLESDERIGRKRKFDKDVKDPKSTGRKRAAVDFPLDFDAACEWLGLVNCGGGKFPIIGCRNGKQQHRHHGPDKNTLNNAIGNVHRICDDCHNIWHSQNDPNYDPNIGHVPRLGTKAELLDRQMKVRYCLSQKDFDSIA